MATQPTQRGSEWLDSLKPVETIDLPESSATPQNESLFSEDEEKNVFGDVEGEGLITPEVTVPTPARVQIAAAASLTGKDLSTENAVFREMAAAVQEFSQLLDDQSEARLRRLVASEQIIERGKAIREYAKEFPDISIDPVFAQSIEQALSNALATDVEEKAKVALEEEAFNNIRELSAAGRSTEARILMNQFQPERSGTLGVIRDHSMKRMLLREAAEKVQARVGQESWPHWLLSTILSIPDVILMGESFSALGNVKEGTNGYSKSWHRLFTPGSDLVKQIEAVQGMSAKEFADFLPQFEKSLEGNADTLGLYDPGRHAALIGAFEQGLTETDAFERNAFSMVDAAALLPVRTATRLMSIPFMFQSAGARRAAEQAVHNAAEIAIRQGEAAAVERTGMNAAEIADELLPTAINPGKSLNIPAVSLSGDTNDSLKAAKELIDELNLPETTRFTSQAELDEAIEETKNRIRERVGVEVKDVDFSVAKTPTEAGSSTTRVTATIGKKEGGGFASREEAVGFLTSRGLIADGERIVDVTTTVERLGPSLADEGFNLRVFHGTSGDFVNLRPSTTGKIGPGIYVVRDPRIAADYAGDAAGANVRPLMVREEKLWGLPQAEGTGWTIPEMKRAIKEIGLPTEVLKDIQKIMKAQKLSKYDSQSFHKTLSDFFRKQGDPDFEDPTGLNRLNDAIERAGYEGLAVNTWGDLEIAIFKPESIRSVFDKNVFKDVSQQWFAKVDLDIPETAFWTSKLRPPRQSFLSKYWKTTSQTSDRRLFEQATRAGQKRNRLYKIIHNNLTKSFRALDKKERMWLEQILVEGDKRSMWFTDDEFTVLYERATGNLPAKRVRDAYYQYRLNNDLEYYLRNSGVYKDKVIRGFESVRFSAFGDQFDTDAMITWSPDAAPKSRVYNLSDDVHYTNSDIHGSHNRLTSERIQELRDQGYVMLRTEKEVTLKDGTTVNYFVAKRDDLEIRPLRFEQLAYKAGGHRLYADKYFVKQALWGTQPDTGKKFLKRPNVWVTAPTIKNARDWADTMNIARRAVLDGEDAGHLDSVVFQGDAAFPTGDEFIEAIKKGEIDPKEEFEAVFDREMPSAYTKNVDIEQFIDEAEVGFNGYYRTTGKMYYSAKGQQLKDYTGQWAPTIDPFEAQSRALNNVAQMSSFSDFKVSAIDRWVKTYRNNLNVRDLPLDQAQSPVHTFNAATVGKDVSIPLRQEIEGQRETIKRILGFETEWDRMYRNFMRSTAEWIVGDSDNAMRQWASTATFRLAENNPVSWLRGWAFDLKLGMLNPGQLVLQSSTMMSALALSFRLGMHGIASVPFVRAYFLSKGSENVLDTLVKRGAHKLAGFADEAEFKTYVRTAARSGFFDLGDTHVLVNDVGPANTFGSVGGAIDAGREMGRFFFYEAEVWNRLTAYRIAYGEAIERFGRDKIEHFEFKDFVAGRAENYSFNMSNESKAAWQTGLMSIPTQFWAYNVRMIEALIGNNFTAPQKLRLAAVQFGMLGTAGLPVVAGISEYVQQAYGVKPDINSVLGTFERGLIDKGLYELFGADVQLSERWGTGTWSSDLVKDIFGWSEYNQKSFAEMAGGATYSITGSVIGAAGQVAKYWVAHESGSEDVNLTEDEFIGLLRQISTVNNMLKAKMVLEYGVLKSGTGSVQVSGLPPQTAVFVALGIPPAELDEISVIMAYNKSRKEDVKELAREINNLQQEAFTIPDKFDVNARKVNMLVKMIPPDMKKEVLKEVHKTRDPSLYDSLMRQAEKRARSLEGTEE